MNARLSSLSLLVSAALIYANPAIAEPAIALEDIPLHWLDCPANTEWRITTLAHSKQSSAFYQAGFNAHSGEGRLQKLSAAGTQSWEAGAVLRQRVEQRNIVLSSSISDEQLESIGRTTLAAIGNSVPHEMDTAHFNLSNSAPSATVYVGTAQGMLHAFDASSGHEWFAYTPTSTIENKALDSGNRRATGFDGAMASTDIQISGQSTAVLVAGFGRAARGMVALEVSDPKRFDAGKILWEFTERDDADVGYMLGTPSIARMRLKLADGSTLISNVVVMASGVATRTSTGITRSAVYVLSLDKATSEPWKLGVNFVKLLLPDVAANQTVGAIEHTLVPAPDNTVERIYVGDLQGNLSRFDVLAGLPLSGKGGTRIFAASDTDGKPQAISQRPAVVFGPDGGYVVLFGTGRYLDRQDRDPTLSNKQSVYAIHDRGNNALTTRVDLAERNLREEALGRIVSGDSFDYLGRAARKGWYVDLLAAERSILSPSLVGSQAWFTTWTPSIQSCALPQARLYVLEALSGLPAQGFASNLPIGQPIPFSSLLSKIAESKATSRDATGKRRITQRIDLVGAGDGAAVSSSVGSSVSTAGRLSWRELVNWMEWRSDSAK